jgi:hypothetical protein
MKNISAEERLKHQTRVKMTIFGILWIWKTLFLKTLDEPDLCLDFESELIMFQDRSFHSTSVGT